MLYDVLPPLIFFASLGGIILVVSRAVLRIRRLQFTNSVQATLHRARTSHASNAADIARIVGPSTKSVRVIKNRVALISQTVRDTKEHLKNTVQEHRESRATRRQARRDAKVISPPNATIGNRVRDLGSGARQAFASRITGIRESAQRRRAAKQQQIEEVAKTIVQQAIDQPKPKLASRLAIIEDTPAGSEAQPAAQSPERSRLFTKQKESPPLRQAREAIDAADHDQAEKILVPYLAEHPKETRAYMMLGEAALAKHDWEEAMEVFEQVVDLSPEAKGGYAALGHAAFEAGKFTRAIEALQHAHNDNPSDVAVIRQLLKIAHRMDNVPMQRSLTEELSKIKKSQKQSQPHLSARAQ